MQLYSDNSNRRNYKRQNTKVDVYVVIPNQGLQRRTVSNFSTNGIFVIDNIRLDPKNSPVDFVIPVKQNDVIVKLVRRRAYVVHTTSEGTGLRFFHYIA